jgi:hypothetical protein
MLFIFFNFHYTRHFDVIIQTLPFREEPEPGPLDPGIYFLSLYYQKPKEWDQGLISAYGLKLPGIGL